MKKLLLLILIFFINISFLQSQPIPELGMDEMAIIDFNKEICYIDTLDDGVKIIKAFITENHYIYYLLNNNECFCIVLYINDNKGIFNFKDTLNISYKNYNNDFWFSKEKRKEYYISLENIGADFPVFYIWGNKYKYPKGWEFLDNMIK